MTGRALASWSCAGVLGALRAKGLRPYSLQKTLDATTFSQALEALSAVPLLQEIGFPRDKSLRAIEHGLWKGHLTCIERLERFTMGRAKRALHILLLRYEQRNLKVLFRHLAGVLANGEKLSELLYSHRYSFLRHTEELPRSMDALRHLTRSSMAQRLFSDAESSYARTGEPFQFDLSLDTGWLRAAADVFGPLNCRFLTAYIGGQSITNVLWLKFYHKLDAEEIFHNAVFAPRFLSSEQFWKLAGGETPDQCLDALGDHPLLRFVREREMEIATVGDVQSAVARYVWSLLVRKHRPVVYDVEAALAFLLSWKFLANDIITALQAKRMKLDRRDVVPLLTTFEEAA